MITRRESAIPVRRSIIEPDIPKVGTFERDQLRGAAAKSNEVLRQLTCRPHKAAILAGFLKSGYNDPPPAMKAD